MLTLFRDSSNNRVYAVGVQYIKWLATQQFADLQAAGYSYTSHTTAAIERICSAHGVPVNVIPTFQGGDWSYASNVFQQSIAINANYRDQIIAEIKAAKA